MTYFIKTFGCQMNVADSGIVAGHLQSLGMGQVESESGADVIVVNTCTVRDDSEHQAFAYIGRLLPLKTLPRYLNFIPYSFQQLR